MNHAEIANAIHCEWLNPEGFFFKLRYGAFDLQGATRVETLLRACNVEPTAATLDRRLVDAIWFIPQFMEWNAESLKSADARTACKEYGNILWALVDGILSIPESVSGQSADSPPGSKQ